MSLLEKAKNFKRERIWKKATDEEKELAMAWVRGEVTLSQISGALGYKNEAANAVYSRLAVWLREIVRTELLDKK